VKEEYEILTAISDDDTASDIEWP